MQLLTDSGVPNVAKVCSRDQSRPVLCAAYLDVDRAVLEATDSYKLVSVPVEIEEGDVSGLIPSAALAALHKLPKRAQPASLRCGEVVSLEVEGGRQEWPRPDGTFPQTERLIPEESARSGFRIRLNAKLLSELAAGLGGDDVTLTFTKVDAARLESDADEGVGFFPSPLRPIIVHNGTPEHGVGLLMPIRLP